MAYGNRLSTNAPCDLAGDKLRAGIIEMEAVNIEPIDMGGNRKAIDNVESVNRSRRFDFRPHTIEGIAIALLRLVLSSPKRRDNVDVRCACIGREPFRLAPKQCLDIQPRSIGIPSRQKKGHPPLCRVPLLHLQAITYRSR